MDTYGIVLLCIVGAVLTVWLIDRLTHGAILARIVQWRPVFMPLSREACSVAAMLREECFHLNTSRR